MSDGLNRTPFMNYLIHLSISLGEVWTSLSETSPDRPTNNVMEKYLGINTSGDTLTDVKKFEQYSVGVDIPRNHQVFGLNKPELYHEGMCGAIPKVIPSTSITTIKLCKTQLVPATNLKSSKLQLRHHLDIPHSTINGSSNDCYIDYDIASQADNSISNFYDNRESDLTDPFDNSLSDPSSAQYKSDHAILSLKNESKEVPNCRMLNQNYDGMAGSLVLASSSSRRLHHFIKLMWDVVVSLLTNCYVDRDDTSGHDMVILELNPDHGSDVIFNKALYRKTLNDVSKT